MKPKKNTTVKKNMTKTNRKPKEGIALHTILSLKIKVIDP